MDKNRAFLCAVFTEVQRKCIRHFRGSRGFRKRPHDAGAFCDDPNDLPVGEWAADGTGPGSVTVCLRIECFT